jgi:FixJ family two-component response regulator
MTGPSPTPEYTKVGSPIVHVVDDDEPTALAMARLLAAAGFEVRTFASADDFLARFDPTIAGCVILDMRMPGPSGLDLQVAIAERENPLPVIFMTGHGEVRDSVRAIQRGAIDFLTKPVEADALLDAVSRALARDRANREARSHRQQLRLRYDRLTPREREVFAHLIGGQLNKQVAADLRITERTIKLHRAQIFRKLETDSTAGLTRMAMELGIEPAGDT